MWIISAETGWTTERITFAFSVRTATRKHRRSQVDLRTGRGPSPTAGGASLRSLTVWVRVPPAPQFNSTIHKNGPEPTGGFGGQGQACSPAGCELCGPGP